jgi:proteasome accessory factor B
MLIDVYPLERLLNLVALLLEARTPLTFDQIRATLRGAYTQEDRASAKRQFERDKDTLRAIGIPVEVAFTDGFEIDEGYVIRKDRYYLPDVSFTPEEAAALFVAANAPGPEGDGREGDAAQAFRKLALGIGAGVGALLDAPAPAGVDASGPHLQAVAEAVAGRRRIRFRYQPAEGEAGEREVDAWALVFRRGAWYLAGLDHRREEARSFRLSRIGSEVRDEGPGSEPPEGWDPGALLAAGPWGLGEPDRTARVAFSPKVAWWATAGIPEARTMAVRDDGWTEVEVPAAAGDSFVSWILSFGPDAEVLGPEDLREAVVRGLEVVRGSV